jgi:hypothetical protein
MGRFPWGTAGPVWDGYEAELAWLGFTRNSAVTHLVLMGQLRRWIAEAGVDVGELSEGRIEEFLDASSATRVFLCDRTVTVLCEPL